MEKYKCVLITLKGDLLTENNIEKVKEVSTNLERLCKKYINKKYKVIVIIHPTFRKDILEKYEIKHKSVEREILEKLSEVVALAIINKLSTAKINVLYTILNDLDYHDYMFEYFDVVVKICNPKDKSEKLGETIYIKLKEKHNKLLKEVIIDVDNNTIEEKIIEKPTRTDTTNNQEKEDKKECVYV
jgi:hypothetical protein